MNRRNMLKLGLSTAATGLVASSLPSVVPAMAQGAAVAAFGSRRSLANSGVYGGSLLSILADSKATGGSYAMYEVLLRQGLEIPPHTHTREDETFYILEGEATFVSGNITTEGKPGDHVFQPRGIQHFVKLKTPTARFIVTLTPGGLEQGYKSLMTPATSLELPPPPSVRPTPEQAAAIAKLFAEQYGFIIALPR